MGLGMTCHALCLRHVKRRERTAHTKSFMKYLKLVLSRLPKYSVLIESFCTLPLAVLRFNKKHIIVAAAIVFVVVVAYSCLFHSINE